MLTQQEQAEQDALKWAARTYVVAALGSIATLLYYVSIYMGGSRRLKKKRTLKKSQISIYEH
jgi:hypothetical protein